ncbi:MAG: hypothetical protein AB7J30_06925 [Hyphomicrobium sp.]|uniref:hypothetical protein n=1 Tax=Hyphomicrobium sp. TaxID=82 RepID=UPI003D102A7F
MPGTLNTLEPGDVVDILYRLWRPGEARGDEVIERWITAHVVSCEQGTWPLARLADGQLTEIRPYMTWRTVSRARERVPAMAA